MKELNTTENSTIQSYINHELTNGDVSTMHYLLAKKLPFVHISYICDHGEFVAARSDHWLTEFLN